MIKRIVKKILPDAVQIAIRKKREENRRKNAIADWRLKGAPIPPPHQLKQQVIIEYSSKYRCPVLVETGTYLGEMIEAQKGNFKKVYSIELGKDLWKKAVEKFARNTHIKILQGDSGKVLREIMPLLNERALFWLDGHYSDGITAKGDKECPILEEIDVIFSSNSHRHILLIDDARCFIGENDYPTIPELREYIKKKNPGYVTDVRDDIIRVTI